MKRKLGKRKFTILALVVAVVLLSAGGAFAFYLLHGSGSGFTSGGPLPSPATVPLTISGTANTAGVFPGCDPTQAGCTNPNGDGSTMDFHVTAVATNASDQSKQVTVNTVTPGAVSIDSGHPGCLASWFVPQDYTPGTPLTNLGVVVTGSTPTDLLGGLHLRFIDNGADQSACIGATVSIAVSAS